MRIFFDTEFYENGRTIQLISIALVREDGRRYAAETLTAEDLCEQDPWLVKNVKPHLRGGDRIKAKETIANEILAFAGENPEFWAYYADYDWVVLCQIYGRMIDLPEGWPMFCRDVRQLVDGRPDVVLPENKGAHDAMADALWCREAHRLLTGARDNRVYNH